jgi:phospholipase/carboxylesterase
VKATLGLCLVLAASVATAAPPSPVLDARPRPVETTLRTGESLLANGAIAYRPRSATAGPFPLIVLLHGAGGYPPRFLRSMEADRRGAILLYPHSTGRTWDVLLNAAAGRDPWSGRDSARLDQSLADLFSRADIDPSRIVLLGFSDGASYALSLGLANPQLFRTVVALSPGSVLAPERIDPSQRIFVAHGRSDRVLSFRTTEQNLVPTLLQRGAAVTFRPFAGNHEIDRKVLDSALDLALRFQAPPQPPTSNPG